ncbi:MAG: trypsin-like peptidase domain-containing protein, partial [Myxococcota bacterium]
MITTAHHRRPARALLVSMVLATFIGGGCRLEQTDGAQSNPPTPNVASRPSALSAEPPPPNTPSNTATTSDELVEYRPISFQALVKRANPGVVNIYTRVAMDSRDQLNQYMPFMPRQREGQSLGTGFIVDAEGLVLTNHHVIQNASQIRVRLWDDREYDAEVVGTDPKTDIALLKVNEAPKLQALPLGDSEALAVGDWVVAIGNALGLTSTVTAGIVSAKGRRRSEVPLGGGEMTYVDFIQTDASINPGNSGGPLLNMRGEVVGINTAISREGQGIGFAIPIGMARAILPQLKSNGKVSRSWLGIYVSKVTAEVAKKAGLDTVRGAQVRRIV